MAKYLIAWPKNGLGDRLKLTCSAWAAADAMDRSFAIRWVSGIGCDVDWHDLFNSILPVFWGDEDRCYEGYNHQDLLNIRQLKRYTNKEVDHIKDSHHKWIEVCAGYFCNGWNYKALLQPYLKKLVTPLPHIQEKIDKVLSQFTGNTLGIHIRRRYGGSVVKMQPKIEEFIDTHSDSKIFACVDSPEDMEPLKQYGDRLVFFEQSHKDRGLEGMSEALVDFCALSKCQEMVGTKGSSFSEMSEILNETKREIVLI